MHCRSNNLLAFGMGFCQNIIFCIGKVNCLMPNTVDVWLQCLFFAWAHKAPARMPLSPSSSVWRLFGGNQLYYIYTPILNSWFAVTSTQALHVFLARTSCARRRRGLNAKPLNPKILANAHNRAQAVRAKEGAQKGAYELAHATVHKPCASKRHTHANARLCSNRGCKKAACRTHITPGAATKL